jgi:hypothetical protein
VEVASGREGGEVGDVIPDRRRKKAAPISFSLQAAVYVAAISN